MFDKVAEDCVASTIKWLVQRGESFSTPFECGVGSCNNSLGAKVIWRSASCRGSQSLLAIIAVFIVRMVHRCLVLASIKCLYCEKHFECSHVSSVKKPHLFFMENCTHLNKCYKNTYSHVLWNNSFLYAFQCTFLFSC